MANKKWIGLQVGITKYLINVIDKSAERFDVNDNVWTSIPNLTLTIGEADQVVFDEDNNILTNSETIMSKGRY